MPPAIDLTSKRFGRLVVTGLAPTRGKLRYWWCRCDCGTIKQVKGASLTHGMTTSCGCYLREATGKRAIAMFTKTGLSKSSTYSTWSELKARCFNPRRSTYKNYGARGIKVCERWLTFENFLADMGLRPPGMTLDRIDNDGNYEPGNCRWRSWLEQQNNRRNNKFITYQGHTRTVSQWARLLGCGPIGLNKRLMRGWSVNQAFTTLPFPRR